ncbi:MAG TPA: response regulator [Pseudolabrys sp.]
MARPGARPQGNFQLAKTCIVSIVDDDASVREAIEDLVSSLGMVACAFESAEDFLNSRRVDDTTCLITDEQMPGMKGHELQRHLRAHGKDMPIIFITAFPEKCGYDRNEQAGMIALLEKPFDGGMLVNYLRNAVAVERHDARDC